MDTSRFGTRTFNVWQNQCYSPYAPLKNGEPTYIDITHKNHDINLINKSWLNVTFEIDWSIDKDVVCAQPEDAGAHPPVIEPVHPYWFVGWKNAAEAIRRIEIYNDEKFTGYLQPDNQTDTFVQFTKYITREEKRENYTSHTIYKDAYNHTHNVCGTYLDMATETLPDGYTPASWTDVLDHDAKGTFREVEPNGTHIRTHTFSVNIPLSEIPALRYFREYPACFKPLTLKLEFSPEAMVWCPCKLVDPPNLQANQAELDKVPNEFCQVNQQMCVISYYDVDDTFVLRDFVDMMRFSIKDFRVKSLTVDVEGYNISDDGKMTIQQQYGSGSPLIIPCLYTYARTFDGIMASRRYHIEFPMAVHNVKDIHLVFPSDPDQKTCFFNPMLKDFQMRINNVNYPDKPLRTDDTRFYKLQINGIHADLDYQNSMTHLESISYWKDSAVYGETPHYTRNSPTDISSFIATIPVERDNEPGVFDGLETGDDNINIHLDGECIKGPTEQTYASDGKGADQIPPSPKIWFTSKAYWTLDTENGLVFHDRGVPNY